MEVFWLTIGDWHLDPQGGETVVDSLEAGPEEIAEDWVF